MAITLSTITSVIRLSVTVSVTLQKRPAIVAGMDVPRPRSLYPTARGYWETDRTPINSYRQQFVYNVCVYMYAGSLKDAPNTSWLVTVQDNDDESQQERSRQTCKIDYLAFLHELVVQGENKICFRFNISYIVSMFAIDTWVRVYHRASNRSRFSDTAH